MILVLAHVARAQYCKLVDPLHALHGRALELLVSVLLSCCPRLHLYSDSVVASMQALYIEM